MVEGVAMTSSGFERLQAAISRVRPVDATWRDRAAVRLDRLTKPPGSLGRLEWIAAHAAPDGGLPEQSQDHLLHPEAHDEWVARWGPPPCPLLWSHAMFLTLDHELNG